MVKAMNYAVMFTGFTFMFCSVNSEISMSVLLDLCLYLHPVSVMVSSEFKSCVWPRVLSQSEKKLPADSSS